VERVLGYTPQELAERSLADLAHPDHALHSIDSWTQLLQEPDHVSTSEMMARHKDGRGAGSSRRRGTCCMNRGVQAVVVNFRDITERNSRRPSASGSGCGCARPRKMEAVGRLAAASAHDFNNFWGASSLRRNCSREGTGESPLKRYAQNILAAATRGASWSSRFSPTAAASAAKRAPVDVVMSWPRRSSWSAARSPPHPSRGERP